MIIKKDEVLTVKWNHLILLDDNGQQRGTVGTVNNTPHRRCGKPGIVMEVWWQARGLTDKQSERVMCLKACCVALRR